MSAVNAKLSDGDQVKAAKLDRALNEAKQVMVSCKQSEQLPALLALIKSQVLKQKYVKSDHAIQLQFLGDTLLLQLLTTSDATKLVMPVHGTPSELKPLNGLHVVTANSQIAFRQPIRQDAGEKVKLEDCVGGLRQQINTIREMIELPLTRPELYENYGLRPPRGILLYGPSGTGKTLIVKSIAQSMNVQLRVINGADIMSKYFGETESKLSAEFRAAEENGPSILFIDEIDTLCPKRSSEVGDTEKRVVACMLTLMDGVGQAADDGKQVIVIGATNLPDNLDVALRRPGRFDKEIEIGSPTPVDRRQILQVHMRNMPHVLTASEVEHVAEITHGYVGADLAGLCREASMLAMMRSATLKKGDISRVTPKDFIDAKSLVKASGMREISLEIPHVRWSDIGGHESVKRKLQESVEWPIRNPEVFARLGVDPPKGVLLYGPPGCSKTLMARAIATESGLNFFVIKGSELFSKWVGDSERAVVEIFRKARAASPSIIFFDEIDALAVHRGGMGAGAGKSGSSSSVGDRVLTQLLTELDGVEPLSKVTIIAATNRPDILDAALMRPGRLDRLLYIPPPDDDARRAIFKLRLAKMPLAPDVDLVALVYRSQGMSGAEIVAVCQEAAMQTLQRVQGLSISTKLDLDLVIVTAQDFDQALTLVRPRITDAQLKYYEDFAMRKG